MAGRECAGMNTPYKLLVKCAENVVCVCSQGEKWLSGKAMNRISMIEKGSVVVGWDGNIEAVGPAEDITQRFPDASCARVIDATGMCVLPGLVDCHTHPVWEGDRVHEFSMKLAGASYLDIHQAGGGIHYTMQHTRTAKQEQLLHSLRIRLFAMLRAGSTLVECKTGYGLDLDTETRMLRAIESARWHDRPAVHVTYCGAHAVPRGHLVSEYTREIVEKHLPTVVRLMHQGEVHVDSVDVFCEQGVFGLEETRTILSTGKNLGLRLNFHGDELHPTGAAELAAELGAHAVSHLEEVSNDGISALVTSGCVAILLPTTAFMLRLKQPPARTMIDAGVIVALGSDFNPNAYCLAMPVVMHLACVNLHFTMAEALVAATINAAHALGCSHRHGSIEQGKRGDLLIVKASRWEHLIYQLGCHADLIPYVVCKGDVVENRCPSYNAAL